MRKLVIAGILAATSVATLAATWVVWQFVRPSTAARGRGVEPVRIEIEPQPITPPSVEGAGAGPPWFSEVSELSGIDFRHVSGDSPAKPFPAANGSGVAIFDFDRDGWLDAYFATGTPFPLDATRSEPTNRLYRNAGLGRFVDRTTVARAGHNGFSAGVAVGDFDSDGFADLFVTCFGPDCLFRNQGDGTFERVERQAGLDNERWGTSAAFLDYDDDGLLDLYVCNYAQWTWETNPYCGDHVRGIRMFCGPRSVEPQVHDLYRNRGDGTFENTTQEAGVSHQRGRGQGVLAADLNGDRRIDLYVANDLNPNFLFLNEGGGRFRDATDSSGAAYDAMGNAKAGMGLDAADIDGDGKFELFVTNFTQEYNTFFQNLGSELFHDATSRYGLVADSLPQVGWGTSFTDFDLDGRLDLIITNGHVDSNRDLIVEGASYAQPPLLYSGAPDRFRMINSLAGPYFLEKHVGRGLAVGDLDRDGDEDVIITHQDHRPAILRNERLRTVAERCTLSLRWVSVSGNRDAIGASMTFQTENRRWHRQIKGGGSYLSASDLGQVIALLPGEDRIRIQVAWPGEKSEEVIELQSPGEYVIVERPGEPAFVLSCSFSLESDP